jgi:hypothetical protein
MTTSMNDAHRSSHWNEIHARQHMSSYIQSCHAEGKPSPDDDDEA